MGLSGFLKPSGERFLGREGLLHELKLLPAA